MYLFWIIILVLLLSLEVVSKPVMAQIKPFTMTFMRFFVEWFYIICPHFIC